MTPDLLNVKYATKQKLSTTSDFTYPLYGLYESVLLDWKKQTVWYNIEVRLPKEIHQGN